ncbi:thioredoxin-like 1-1, chloroplastic [Trifolium pratense]|uniref:thioredoxin-like 1-1, chloroplastic n=1 Tax=Trifolium pratense TaxID=57577 RepID=UPI001E695A58|nr:thioredoxin-like 1-1, chloroplastic [Trifolium pratense]
MAEILTKTSFVSSWHGNKNQKLQRASMVPKACSFNVGLRTFPSLKMKSQFLRSSSFSSEFHGKKPLFRVNRSIPKRINSQISVSAAPKMTLRIGKVQKWWEKGHQPNMREVTSAQDLVDSLLNAGDKLVIVDFFSPGCGGCKALHPKICQFAEMNPDVEFLQVNYEEHKSMCYSLNVHVLPFFRFYRGAHGRLCSFSCTNATIKKFRDALAKHTPDRCSLEPTKGLEEKELIALSENRDLDFTYTPKPSQPVLTPANEESVTEATPSLPSKERTLITAWR